MASRVLVTLTPYRGGASYHLKAYGESSVSVVTLPYVRKDTYGAEQALSKMLWSLATHPERELLREGHVAADVIVDTYSPSRLQSLMEDWALQRRLQGREDLPWLQMAGKILRGK